MLLDASTENLFQVLLVQWLHLGLTKMLRLLTLYGFILVEAKDVDMYLHISTVFRFPQCCWCTYCSLDEFLEDCVAFFDP